MSTPAVSSLKGTGYNQISLPRLTPQQQQLFSHVFSGLSPHIGGAVGNLSQLAAGGTPEQWNQLEAPALRQFGQLQGNIASRFSGLGSGARNSSAFQNTQNSAAQELAESLQGQRMGIQQNALQQLLGLYGNLMGQDFNDKFVMKKQAPWWQELLSGLNQAGSQAAGYLGGRGLSVAAGVG